MKVGLRAVQPADEAWLREWLPAIARETGRPVEAMPGLLAARDIFGRIVEVDGAAAGAVAWTLDDRVGRFRLLALEPRARRRGHGVEAAMVAEREMLAARGEQALAPVPGSHGIAVYFWLRLGYRMLSRSQWPECEGSGPVAWMGRDLRPAGGGSDD